jgi:hypothetical protein
LQIWVWLHSHVNPLYVLLADGSIRNDYTVRILNKGATRKFALDVSGCRMRWSTSQASSAMPTAN